MGMVASRERVKEDCSRVDVEEDWSRLEAEIEELDADCERLVLEIEARRQILAGKRKRCQELKDAAVCLRAMKRVRAILLREKCGREDCRDWGEWERILEDPAMVELLEKEGEIKLTPAAREMMKLGFDECHRKIRGGGGSRSSSR